VEVELEVRNHDFHDVLSVCSKTFLEFTSIAYQHLTSCRLLFQTRCSDTKTLLYMHNTHFISVINNLPSPAASTINNNNNNRQTYNTDCQNMTAPIVVICDQSNPVCRLSHALQQTTVITVSPSMRSLDTLDTFRHKLKTFCSLNNC